MANKYRWFTHDHDAHEDAWVRNLVRKQGHVAGWLWWVLVENLHRHGNGDTMRRDINDLARAGLTSASVLVRVLTEMATEFQGQSKVRWNLVGTELELEIKKFKEKQAKKKTKLAPDSIETSSNLPKQYSTEHNSTEHTPIPPNGGWPGFDVFWGDYPKKVDKLKARKLWNSLKPDGVLFEKIRAAIKAQVGSENWTKEGGKYIPGPAVWLGNHRWDDELKPLPGGLVERDMWAIEREKMLKRQNDATTTTEF